MSSERRGAVVLLLDSIGAFQSMLLRVMVAVWRRGLQRGVGSGVGGVERERGTRAQV